MLTNNIDSRGFTFRSLVLCLLWIFPNYQLSMTKQNNIIIILLNKFINYQYKIKKIIIEISREYDRLD